jgi:DNA repair protein RecN (Recombination protein N)
MLKHLHVQNFALIDDLDMDFLSGMSALTGETGAGKSIILESLQLLFGKRSDATMIRYGEQKAHVKGVFVLSRDKQASLSLPEVIEVERDIDKEGRHLMKINGEVTTLSRIKEVMTALGSIHSQTETMSLFDKSYYLELIDQVDIKKIDELKNQYLLLRSDYLAKKKHHESLKEKKHQSIEKKSFLEYQLEELKAFNLTVDEKVHLDEKIAKLKNYDKIMSSLKSGYQALESDIFSIDTIYDAAKYMEKIAHLDPSYQEMADRLTESYYNLDDVKSLMYQQIESLDFDEDEFNQMQERSYELVKIETKYQKTINELILYLKEVEEELLLITDYDHYLETSKKEVDACFKKAFDQGLKLSDYRKKLAKKLASEVLVEVKDLDLEKASFDIVFDDILNAESSLQETGLDSLDFFISLNEGEPVKPLSKVASGGERARFMFALKAIYAKANQLSLLILDEIDIGISGKTASKVAQKMKFLSQTMQLIVITHLPQVAARATHHYGIRKQKENERMVTRIHKLTEMERIEQVALMLSDEKLTHFAIEQAKLLLEK